MTERYAVFNITDEDNYLMTRWFDNYEDADAELDGLSDLYPYAYLDIFSESQMKSYD